MSSIPKIKTCIIGDSTVGKTSIISRIHEDVFKDKTMTTTGIDYFGKI
jgi:GTPase SAR1 family protein